VRENAVWVAVAAAATAAMAWLGLAEFGWNDYEVEAQPAVSALVHGHLDAFFKLAPVYGGSLLERAPFALAPSLWGGGELAVYRMMALPCLLAAAALGLWLVAWMRRSGRSRVACALALVICTANPLTLLALEIGHPDELLGGALCVGAVLLAARGRGVWAGLALGAAIANKQWALLAIAPVLVALPARRLLCLSIAGSVAVALLAPFALAGPDGFMTRLHAAATSTGAASSPGVLFQPWQIWWFLGPHAHAAPGLLGTVSSGARIAPGWVETISHPLILAVALPLGLGAWMRLRRSSGLATIIENGRVTYPRPEVSALLLLALLLLLRCMLDPWDNIYYPIPFVLALLAWEALAFRRPPLLALGCTVAVWGGHHWMGAFASMDAQAAFFVAWSVPLAIALGVALYGWPGRVRVRRSASAHSESLTVSPRRAEGSVAITR